MSSKWFNCIPSVILLRNSTHSNIIPQPIHLLMSSVLFAPFNFTVYQLWCKNTKKYSNIFFPLKNKKSCKEIPSFSLIKNFSYCELLFSSSILKEPPEKQQRDNLLSNSSEIEGFGIYFATEPHRPHITNSLVYIEVITFCGSQPCSPSREQRYYGLIELEHRFFVRKLIKVLQLPWLKLHKNFACCINALRGIFIKQWQFRDPATKNHIKFPRNL